MTLIKQLWLAILFTTLLAIGGSLVLSVLSARHYLEQQLQVKNIDNANALALSLSQFPKDPILVELQVAAQFDAGHYRYIRITSPSGKVVVERVFQGELMGAPLWFIRLIPIEAKPGVAQIQEGWKQYGSLSLASHEQYVYQALWQGTLNLFYWFALGGLLTAGAATLAMRRITHPLNEVVAQAKAISVRRFLHITEPKTPELRSVVRAMNSMVDRLKAMFGEEAARVEAYRQRSHVDSLTGLANRAYFMSQLQELTTGESHSPSGSLVMLRLTPLDALNAQLGHERTNALLRQLAWIFKTHAASSTDALAARLMAGEFVWLCPGSDSPLQDVQAVQKSIQHHSLSDWVEALPNLYHLAAVSYHRGQSVSELMSRADEAMAFAQAQGPQGVYVSKDDHARPVYSSDQWRKRLADAVKGEGLSLAFYPVRSIAAQALLHHEGVLRWYVDADTPPLVAGDFMPMAMRLKLTAPIDLHVAQLAIQHLSHASGNVAINVAAQSMTDFKFMNDLTALLAAHPKVCERLLFEVPEYGVDQHFDVFDNFVQRLKQLKCRVGIEYFSESFALGNKLATLSLDYIKVHPSYIRGLADQPSNQEFLKGLCNAARVLGIQVIALGVVSETELPLLGQLGFDGVTGPGIM